MISAQERRGDAQHNKGDVQVVVEESNLPQRRRILKRSSQRDKDDVQVVVSPSQKRMLKGSSQRCKDVVQVVVEESSLPQKRRMMNGSYSRYRNYSSIINNKNTVVKSIEGFTYDLGLDQVSTELNRIDSGTKYRENIARLSVQKRRYKMVEEIMTDDFDDIFGKDDVSCDSSADADEVIELKRAKLEKRSGPAL